VGWDLIVNQNAFIEQVLPNTNLKWAWAEIGAPLKSSL
jgi:hypothetical protein